MKKITMIELEKMNATEIRELARTISMPGAWKAKKSEMITFIYTYQLQEQAKEKNIVLSGEETIEELEEKIESAVQPVEVPVRINKGRTRTIEVYKNGELFITISGLLETFKWAVENNVCNQGWVKQSLKTGQETIGGRKFKEGGYLFKYSK